jgi:hypothetical protein
MTFREIVLVTFDMQCFLESQCYEYARTLQSFKNQNACLVWEYYVYDTYLW